jgi:hypothetical protein
MKFLAAVVLCANMTETPTPLLIIVEGGEGIVAQCSNRT